MDELLIIIITLAASAFFSGMEIAFITSDKLRLELDKNINPVNNKLITTYTQYPGHYIATMLVGNNIALVVYGLAFIKLLEPILSPIIANSSLLLIAQTILSTIVILFIAEFIPKTLFRIYPNLALNVFAIPVGFFYVIFYPVTKFAMLISKALLRRFFSADIIGKQEEKIFSKIDLNNFVSENDRIGGDIDYEEENEIKLFRNALDFSKVKLRDCMIPRPEIEALEKSATIKELRQRFIETGYSKILIYKDSIDNIIGYVHSSDLFTHPKTVSSCLHQITYVPETMEANKLLSKFLREHKSIAIVVDEFGGTAGMVTSEDILEEIFGEIEDEHDTIDLIDKKINTNTYVFSGRMEIDSINEKYHTDLHKDDNYETIAGYILHNHSSIPKLNTVINIGKFEFKILRVSKTRIELVELKILSKTK
jgi:CBS domain containing-hemolysin-like protein